MALQEIQQGNPVIISGVFSRPNPYHNQLKAFIAETGVPLKFFYVEPPEAQEVERRIQERIKSPDNRSNITSYEGFVEVLGRYQLIQDIEIKTVPPDSSIEERTQFVQENLQDLMIP